MSHIDELIEELCPNGVEYRPLGDAAVLTRGTSITSKQVSEGEIPVIGGGRSAAYTHGEHNRVGETVVVAGSGAYAGYVSWWDRPIFVSDAFTVAPYASILVPRYCFHWLRSRQTEIHALKSGGGVPHVYARDVGRLRIPVPPLAVQQEIVRILDKFTALEAELEAELEARRKQYEHYRAEAFRRLASDSSKWMTLGAVCDRVSTGATPRAGESSFYEAGDVPWLRTNEVVFRDIWDTELRVTERALSETGISLISKDCVIVAISGATAGRSAVNRIPLTTNQHCCNLQVDSSVAYFRYVYHWVRFQYEALKARGRGPRKDLNVRLICEHPIPVPPLDEQRRIADILDKFDALVNDLSVGLPAELAARRKQYEYYRDRLLTFKELAE